LSLVGLGFPSRTLVFSSAEDNGKKTVEAKKGSFLLKTVQKDSDAKILALSAGENDRIGKELIAQRDKQLGPNVSVFYKQDGGLVIVRGEGAHMIDVDGNRHLDCCNNVAQVGHSHPKVVEAGRRELGNIQTNARFLNPVQQRYLAKLLATFPPELNRVYLVNSGSEANDLALRIARQHTKAKNKNDVIVLDSAYHGHTQSLVDISPYKWYQATDGVNYHPPGPQVVPLPDSYRGKHRGFTEETGLAYAKYVEDVVKKTGGVGVFIAESIVGCGGQVGVYIDSAFYMLRSNGVDNSDSILCTVHVHDIILVLFFSYSSSSGLPEKML
jgi:4-aminobutyrate aminotransferase-like enzyme